MKVQVPKLQQQFQTSSTQELLRFFFKKYQDRIALASSLGAEDQVLTDFILKIEPKARIFILDTGRLPQETYETITKTMDHYGRSFEIYFPQTSAVESLVSQNGPDLFYEGIEKRHLCCGVRKVEPLKRVLNTLDVWITGLRRDQSVTRQEIQKIEWDETNQLVKINPLIEWSTEQVWQYIKDNKIPYNRLHDQGYPSIGCAPCTRAIKPGEDIRAGRWWWEAPEHKECGLHFRDGKLVRRNET
ncbi:MAG TPA: phosphoadenylyl-sulfate reductase [Bacillota bacterium]|nr:phosphoadenylyl-sulfate reductase [Bacillota bacterium]